TRVSGRSVPGDCRDLVALGSDLPDPVVEGVRDVQVARRIDCYSGGKVEARLCRRRAVARVVRGAGSGHRGDRPSGVDLAYPVVLGVGDVHVAGSIGHDARTIDRKSTRLNSSHVSISYA